VFGVTRSDGKRVIRLERGSAVLEVEKLMREAELKRRMAHEIGDRAYAELVRAVRIHAERIGVVEAERYGNAETMLSDCRVQVLHRCGFTSPEQLEGDRPCIFGIDVDRAAFERGKDNRRIAEPRVVRGCRFAGLTHRLRNDLAEDVRLGEPLRADLDRLAI